jgi:hypothetical protein
MTFIKGSWPSDWALKITETRLHLVHLCISTLPLGTTQQLRFGEGILVDVYQNTSICPWDENRGLLDAGFADSLQITSGCLISLVGDYFE